MTNLEGTPEPPLDPAQAESILRGMSGLMLGYLGARSDASDAHRRQRPDEQARYRALVEQMPAIVFMAYLDAPASEAFISPQIETILGFSRDEWVHDPVRWYHRIHPDDRARWSTEGAALFSSGEPLRSVYRVISRTNTIVWLRCDVRLVRDEDGRPWFVHGVAFDITEMQEAQQAIVARTAELQTANRELEAFSYSVAHDLRGPLRSIASFTDLLARRAGAALDEKSNGYLSEIRGAAIRMGQLIDALLNLSRITRSQIARQPVDLTAVAHDVMRQIRREEPQRPVVVNVTADMTISADPPLIRIVMENLLGNAWKFTRKNPKALIEVGRTTRHGKPAYFVRDNGAGFDMSYVSKLFRPFHRLHNASEFQGSGIGLAITDRIIRRHGGEIWAEASVGRGATFYFTLEH